jgi:type I restriction enzyme S subunit
LDSLQIAIHNPIAQRKIAAILSAYDDLIENNTRCIAILEQMARLLYREWFVHFRFPGHEDVAMIDSELGAIPEGWEVVRVKDIVKRLGSGKKYKQKEVSETGNVPVIPQSQDKIMGFHNNEPDHKPTPEKPIVLFGDHTCKMTLMIRPFSIAANVVPFVSSDDIPVYYLFHLTYGLIESREYRRHWTPFKNRKVICAPNKHTERFVKIVSHFYRQREILARRNRTLRRARDLLLPRLVSGDLDVADLPIDGAQNARND